MPNKQVKEKKRRKETKRKNIKNKIEK